MNEHPFVEATPGVGGGYRQVRGTRTPVRCIVEIQRQTRNLEQTAALFPHLTREEVCGALDYYAACPARVDEDIARNERGSLQNQSRQWPAQASGCLRTR